MRATDKALRPKGYSDAPKTLGEHLRRRRLQLGLLQREAAKGFGIVHSAYIKWELDRVEPEIRYWPALIRFLGYDPHPKPETIGEWIACERRPAGGPESASHSCWAGIPARSPGMRPTEFCCPLSGDGF